VADEILGSWLKRFGQGKAIFPEEESIPAGVDDDDRQVEATLERESGAAPDPPGRSLPAGPVAPPGP
jgi:hypothetical protein